MDIAVRPATLVDADALTAIAHAAKRYWGYPERWIHLWRDALTITPAFIRHHPVHVAAADGAPVGFYALIPGTDCTLEHLWVLPDWMGQGIGRLLFEHAIHTAAALGALQLVLEADPHAEGFYAHLGAVRAGEVIVVTEGVTRTLPRMVVTLGKL